MYVGKVRGQGGGWSSVTRRKQVKGRQGEDEGDLEAKADKAGVLKTWCGAGPALQATAPGVLPFCLCSVLGAPGFRTWCSGVERRFSV